MSYQAVDLLSTDLMLQGRVRACVTEQSMTFKDDARGDIKALALACLRNEPEPIMAFQRAVAGAPGLADKATTPDGSVDSALITDGDLLSAVQANYPTVAALYFAPDGTPQP